MPVESRTPRPVGPYACEAACPRVLKPTGPRACDATGTMNPGAHDPGGSRTHDRYDTKKPRRSRCRTRPGQHRFGLEEQGVVGSDTAAAAAVRRTRWSTSATCRGAGVDPGPGPERGAFR